MLAFQKNTKKMKNIKNKIQTLILLVGLIIILPSLSSAQCSGDNTFTGATDNDWNTISNWSAGCVPTSPITGHITISDLCTNSSINLTFDVGSTLEIESGVSFTNLPSSFTINGTLINEGTFTHSNFTNDGIQIGTGTHIGDLTLNGTTKPGFTAPPAWTCGDPLVYAGQSYATIQIGGQCWMAENLNVGTMVNGTSSQTNNSIIEKYCYNNNAAECTTYGALYQWDEMMQYSTVESTQGICPTDWHLPSDDEYKTLEMELGMSQAQANNTGYRGTDQGSQLAGNEPLWTDGNLDQNANFGTSGFAALPSGYRVTSGSFYGQSSIAYLWSSSESGGSAWYRYLYYGNPKVLRTVNVKSLGFSVRCVRD